MASSSFTPNLHLSAWSESDRPKRADFVSDNNIIDTQLGGHIADSDIHVTSAEKAKISAPFASTIYSGTGESQRAISVGFQPKFAVVYRRGVPPVVFENGVTVVNAACGYYSHGASAGLSVTSSGVTVSETAAADGIRLSLNENGAQYTVVAFK